MFKPSDFSNIANKNFVLIIINLIFVGIIFLNNQKKINYDNRNDFNEHARSPPENSNFVTPYAYFDLDK